MIDVQLRSLMASLAIHVEAWALEEATELLDAGEPGLAFDTVCDCIYDGEIGVFPGEVVEIESIGRQLGSARRAWQLIRELQIGD